MQIRNITAFELGEIWTTSEEIDVISIVVIKKYNDDGTPYYVAPEFVIQDYVEYIDTRGNIQKGKCVILID